MEHIASKAPKATLLQAEDVAGYLASRGLVPAGTPVTVHTLGGGVSNVVYSVRGAGVNLVLKQALPRLRVADVWEADQARAVREGLALRTLHALTPEAVPDCVDLDDARYVLVMPHAPSGWTDWKSRLLAGDADVATAARLGRVLATWHLATRVDVPDLLCDRTAFEQLRADPYYRTVMVRRPDLADAVATRLDRLLTTAECLVHGDFSPKNVILGADGLWVIDLEVAHYGDPAFDLAFMLSHLVLKSVRRPAGLDAYGACAVAFANEYEVVSRDRSPSWEHVVGHVGCLLLARVVGKSPVEYLDEGQRSLAMSAGEDLLLRPSDDVPELWTRIGKLVGP